MHFLDVKMEFEFLSEYHTSGDRFELWLDKALKLDPSGKKGLIPATTLKGWLRSNAEAALRGMGAEACDSSSPTTTCGTCPVCQVFGHPRGRSPLRFFDVEIDGLKRGKRMHVSVSRFRRAAYEERLFSEETGFSPRPFSARAMGLFSDRELALDAAALLLMGAKVGFAVGGKRGTGLGWIELKGCSFSLDGEGLSIDELEERMTSLARR